MRPCVTHHHACDCREAEFARIKAENDDLRIALMDAIKAPMGIVPASAEPFYDGQRGVITF